MPAKDMQGRNEATLSGAAYSQLSRAGTWITREQKHMHTHEIQGHNVATLSDAAFSQLSPAATGITLDG